MGIVSDLIRNNEHPEVDPKYIVELEAYLREIGVELPRDRLVELLIDAKGDASLAFERAMALYQAKNGKNSNSSPEISPSSSNSITRKRSLTLLHRDVNKKRRDSRRESDDEVVDVTECDKAVKILMKAVEHACNSQSMSDAEWRENICKQLDLPATPQILTDLTHLCDSAAAYKEAHNEEKFPLFRLSSEIIDDLSQISPTGPEKLARQPHPSDDTIESHKLNVNELTACDTPDTETVSSSFLPQKVVNCVKNLCEAYVARLEWGARTENIKLSIRTAFEGKAQAIIQEKKQQMRECSKDLNGAHEKVYDRERHIRDVEQKLERLVATYSAEQKLDSNGQPSSCVAACLDVLQSRRPDIMSLIAGRENYKQDLAKERQCLKKVERHGEFLAATERLFNSFCKQRQFQINEDIAEFSRTKHHSDRKAIEGLMQAIPKLSFALNRFGAYFHLRWKKSEAKLNERRHELEEHKELFGDDAPSERKQLEVRVREYQNISLNCCTALQQMASSQATFWSNCYQRLPEEVARTLIMEFRALHEKQPTSAMKEMLGNFLSAHSMPVEPVIRASGGGIAVEKSAIRPSEPMDSEMIEHTTVSLVASEDEQMTDAVETTATDESTSMVYEGSNAPTQANPDIVVGTPIVTRFKVGANNKYVRGVVAKCLDNGKFSVEYSDGDVHEHIERKHLLTESDLLKHVSEGFNMDAALNILHETNDFNSMSDQSSWTSSTEASEPNNSCCVM